MNQKFIYLALTFLSLVLALRLISFHENIQTYPAGSVISFKTQLLDQPEISYRGQQMSLIMPNSQRLYARLELDPLLSYGDYIRIQGKIQYFQAENKIFNAV